MTEVKNYFKYKEAKKLNDELRKQLRGLNITLRMSYDIFELNKEHVASHSVRINRNNFFGFVLKCDNPRILVLDFNSYYGEMQIDASGFVEYLTEVGEALNSSAVIVQNWYSQISIPDNIAEIKNDFKLFVNSCDTRDKFYYINLKENFIEDYLGLYNGVSSYLNSIKEKDKTFEFTFKSLKKEKLTWNYYFKGFDGEIFINVEDDSFIFDVPSLEIKRENVKPEDLHTLMDETFEDSENEVKIKSLIKPPNKHFLKYFHENVLPGLVSCENIAEQVFTLLIEDMDAEEIESTIAQSLPVELVTFCTSTDCNFIKLFNVYFILDKIYMTADKYTDFHVALAVYEEIALRRAKENYEATVAGIKTWLSSITPK